ncbi:GNAT family N-acetyltransferase [Sutcliffiella cohnii]|uniref:GNAT family N-acetyltransferase n=1 Tax=Sutcliffiella cohnii TaxID=33932 RepID=UPI002E1C0E97|nr:GNAT family N-acetyltransferase [Sutcliffiella cohnii]
MEFKTTIDSITVEMLEGFFVGWPQPPSQQTHLTLLKNSDKVVLALDEETNKVIGFITAISDGVLSAYIPFLEVLPTYQNRGIGRELVQRMLKELDDIYMIDLMCDEELQPYYEKLGLMKSVGMIRRNYSKQSGI